MPKSITFATVKRNNDMEKNYIPTILVTNDDGFQAQGIRFLADILAKLGRVIVVAPDSARSGAACSITPTCPVSVRLVSDDVYACSGTPVDCVKIALEKILIGNQILSLVVLIMVIMPPYLCIIAERLVQHWKPV